MARRRGGLERKWLVWIAAAALAIGCGLALTPFLPTPPVPRVTSVAVPGTAGRALRDPLAIGPEAVVPEALRPTSPPLVADVATIESRKTPPVRPAVAPSARAFTMPPLTPVPAGEAAWRRYAVPVAPEDGRPMIAIVIDDMGLDRRHSDEAADLPAPLTLSFMTYAEDLPTQVATARARGHEIMLHVPMEPQAPRVDPGPNALKLALDEDEIKRRMNWDLARIDGIVGVNNHMGSRFTESAPGMATVLTMLRERGLFFLDSRTTPHSVGIDIAIEIGLPHAARDIFLDVDLTDPAVASELAKTEAVARRNGIAVAIGHPHDPTLTELRRWLPLVEARGFRLVPVSAIVQHNEATRIARAAAPD
jgi:polysaccharide deacetylase 2 family uncharacterized protein YibQ